MQWRIFGNLEFERFMLLSSVDGGEKITINPRMQSNISHQYVSNCRLTLTSAWLKQHFCDLNLTRKILHCEQMTMSVVLSEYRNKQRISKCMLSVFIVCFTFSGVTRERGRPPRVTTSSVNTSVKFIFWLNLESTVDKRRRRWEWLGDDAKKGHHCKGR